MKLPIKFDYQGVNPMILAQLIWRIYGWNWVREQSQRCSAYYNLDSKKMIWAVHDRTFINEGMHKKNVMECFVISERMTSLILSGVSSWDGVH